MTEIEKILTDNHLLIMKVISVLYQTDNNLRSYEEDLIQEARMSVCRSYPKFDNTKGALSTFIYTCVRRHLLRYIKQFIYKYDKNESKDGEDLFNIKDKTTELKEYKILKDMHNKSQISIIMNSLSKEEQEYIIQFYFNNKRGKEIANIICDGDSRKLNILATYMREKLKNNFSRKVCLQL